MNDLMSSEWVSAYLVPWGTKLVMAIVIFVVGRWLARVLIKVLAKGLQKANVDAILTKFLKNIAYGVLLVAVALAALDSLGVNVTSLLAVLGAAGLAVGLALKDSLSNFAAGVMLVIFRPFKVGDFVSAGGVSGTVDEITLFSTLFRTGDNQRLIVPNSAVFGSTITNVNALGTRRVDMQVGIGYGDDMNKAIGLISEILSSDERILHEPAPGIAIAELADSCVNINVKPWVNAGDYWGVRADFLKAIKEKFDANGISIPYPQQDVHMHEVRVA